MPLRVVPRRDRKLHRKVKTAPLIPLRRGEVLYRRGESARSLVLVRRGHLRLVVPPSPAAPERTAQVVGPWELAGEEALLASGRRSHRAVAGEVSAIQWIDAAHVTSVLGTSEVTRSAFLAAWLRDRDLLGHLNAGSSGPDAAGRLASVVLHLAERLDEGEDAAATIPIQLTHQTLADLAGLHRSTVTTLLNDWLYRGWIADARPGLRIDDPDPLLQRSGLPRPR